MRRRGPIAAGLVLVVVVAAALAVAAAMWGWRAARKPEPAASAPEPSTGTVKFLMEQQWAIRMKLAKAEPATVARQITAMGRVVAAPGHHAVVAPPVAGLLVDHALPRVGQVVARGQTLAVLRQMPSAAEAAQIAAGQVQIDIERVRLEAERGRQAEAVREAEARLAHARLELERAQRLHERKAYSRRQLEAAEAEYRMAEASHAAAVAHRDALRNAGALAPPPAPPTYTLQAPIAGSVTRVAKSLGEPVGAGEAILEMVSLDTVWIEVPLFERDLARVSRDVRAVFSAPGGEVAGRLVDIGAVVDPESRAATLRFEVPNRERTLRIGQQTKVRLAASERVPAMMIPTQAVIEAEGKTFVYVLKAGEEFERREVTLGDEHGERVAVTAGLTAGERVVTQGAWQLRQHELRPAGPGAHTHET